MIEIQIQDEEVLAALRRLVARMADLSPAMRAIAGALADQVEEGFSSQSDPATGQAWPGLSPVTMGNRRKRGHWPGRILQDTGQLAASWTPASGPDWASVGTNKVYATTMNFGARKGEFGRTRRGAPIPWGDIPARRMVPIANGRISDDLRDELLSILQRYLDLSA